VDILTFVGAFAFGVVVGWVTYGSLRRAKRSGLTDITTVVGAVGGAAVTKLFPQNGTFGCYCIGLAIGFFFYLIVAARWTKAPDWLGEADPLPRSAGHGTGRIPPVADDDRPHDGGDGNGDDRPHDGGDGNGDDRPHGG